MINSRAEMEVKKMDYQIGDKIRIIKMFEEPEYDEKVGIIEHIDDAGQIHGTWGGCALIPNIDKFEVIEGS